MSVDQVTMNTHSSSIKAVRVAFADPQQRERRQQRIEEAADVPAERPSRGRSGSIRRTSRSRPRRRAPRRRSRRATAATQRDRDQHQRRSAVRTRSSFTGHRSAAGGRRNCSSASAKACFVEVRPQGVEEQQLGIGRLPQQEIRQADFARGADQQVELGQVAGLELGGDRLLVDRRRRRSRRPRPWPPARARPPRSPRASRN